MMTVRSTLRAALALTVAFTIAAWLVGVPMAGAREQGPPDHAGTQGPPDHSQAPDDAGPPEAPEPGGDDEAEAPDEPGDPNRGTVKVRDGLIDYDGSPRHEPPADDTHVGCAFTIVFLGFDAGEREFWLSTHPPTGDGEILYISDVDLEDARGNELSATYEVSFDVLNANGDLNETNRHDGQGWKLGVTVQGPKHRNVWVDCPLPDDGPDADADVEALEAPVDDNDVDEDAVVALFGIGGAEPVAIAGAAAVDPMDNAPLPVTGVPILVLFGLGLALLAAGGGGLRVGRRTDVSG